MFEMPKDYVEDVANKIDAISLNKPKQYLLNYEQQAVLEEVKQKKNVFITGPGGVGKSFLIREIKRQLEADGKKVAITALTGMAAILIGEKARTIHSWAGIGTGSRSVDDMYNFIRKCPPIRESWRTINTLIIDEISMMSAELFEKLDELGRRLLWKLDKPFGGIQIICLGDFYQLPPINARFVFESPKWEETIQTIVLLDTIYRQKDPVFQKILNEVRLGHVSDETDAILKKRLDLDFSDETIKPTKVFTRRDIVDYVNREELEKIESEIHLYTVSTLGKPSTEAMKNAIKYLDSSAPYVETLRIKVGAQVMLIVNLDQGSGLVNGKVGIVNKCKPSSVMVTFKGNEHPVEIPTHEWSVEKYENIRRKQIPLILAYAVTCHRIQGATLESAYIDIGPSVFEYGQAYVALSRVKSLNALYLHDYDRKAVRAHPKVLKYYESLEV